MSDERLAALEARLRELEDVRAIEDLFFKWHYACTGGFTGKPAGRMEALECLTEDATIEILGLHQPGQGPRGREQYTEFWEYFYGDDGPLPFVFQTSVADRVTVTGDTAVQLTNMLGIFQVRNDDGSFEKATIGLSQRTNYLERTPDGWRINRTTMEGGFNIPVDRIEGAKNVLPATPERRTPWTYRG